MNRVGKYGNVNIEDQEILKGCLKNDRQSQELLYRKYARQMYHICLSYSGDKDEAKDILQEAFLKVFRNLDKFRDEGSMEGWIRRIVSNTSIDYYRSKRRTEFSLPIEEAWDLSASEGNEAEIKLGAEEVFGMIKQLPEGARVIFNLYAVEGYSHKEIADKLEISESTSKSQYQRARSLLIEMITKREAS